MKIVRARATDAEKLTELTIRSKSHWNYSNEQIRQWKDELMISAEYIGQNDVFMLFENEELMGYYSVIILDKENVKLDNLFIDPRHIGKAYGTKLLESASRRFGKLGYRRIILDSDPNATGFYEKMGFKVIGKRDTSIECRYLPIMELRI